MFRSYDSSDAENPGNNLYVTKGKLGDLCVGESYVLFLTVMLGVFLEMCWLLACSAYACAVTLGIQVEGVHLVVDTHTRESRGFGFVIMSSLKEVEC